MKKVVSILLVVCMMLSIMPFAMAAVPAHEHDGECASPHYIAPTGKPCVCGNPSPVYDMWNGVYLVYCQNCGGTLYIMG